MKSEVMSLSAMNRLSGSASQKRDPAYKIVPPSMVIATVMSLICSCGTVR